MILLLQFFALTAKKLQLNYIKKHLSKTAVKLKDCLVQLRDDANVWRKMAVISKSWETDCTTASRSSMDRMRSLYSGQKKKIKTSNVGITSSNSFSEIDSIAVDRFGMLHLLKADENRC